MPDPDSDLLACVPALTSELPCWEGIAWQSALSVEAGCSLNAGLPCSLAGGSGTVPGWPDRCPAGPFGDPLPLPAPCALGGSWPALWQDNSNFITRMRMYAASVDGLLKSSSLRVFVSVGRLLHNKLTLEKVCSHSGLHFPDPQIFSVLTNTSLFYRDRILRIASLYTFFLER